MKTKIDKRFGSALRRLREERGFGVRAFARKVGVHPTYVSKVELADVPPPSWEKIATMAYVLDSPTLAEFARDVLRNSLLANLTELGSKGETIDSPVLKVVLQLSKKEFKSWISAGKKMIRHWYISGEAGSGKTEKLMEIYLRNLKEEEASGGPRAGLVVGTYTRTQRRRQRV